MSTVKGIRPTRKESGSKYTGGWVSRSHSGARLSLWGSAVCPKSLSVGRRSLRLLGSRSGRCRRSRSKCLSFAGFSLLQRMGCTGEANIRDLNIFSHYQVVVKLANHGFVKDRDRNILEIYQNIKVIPMIENVQIPENESSKQILDRINKLAVQLLNRFEKQIKSKKQEGEDFATYVQQLGQLRQLLNSVQIYSELQTQAEKDQFFKQSKTLQTRAKTLKDKPINKKWHVKCLKTIQEALQEIIDHEDKQHDHIYAKMHDIRVFLRITQHMLTFDQNDLFSLCEEHPKWQEIKAVVIEAPLSPPQQIEKSRKKLKDAVLESGGMTHYSSNWSSKIGQTIVSILSKIKMSLNPGHSMKAHAQFKNNLNIEKARAFLGGMDMGLTSIFVKLISPSIKYHKLIYITPAYPKLTGLSVLKWLRGQTKKPELEKALPVDEESSKKTHLKEAHKIEVYINSPFDLERKKEYTGDEPGDVRTIILQIHGGGWIAMSPNCHQMYLRQWANMTGAPIFSPNYKKAPEYPFPEGLDDNWQIYNWLLNESHKHYKICKDKQIIVCGDSAGGNLSFALTNLILDEGIQSPCCLAGFYPSLTTSGSDRFTPSHLTSLRDPMLSYDFRQFCADCYVQNKEFDVDANYLLSPIFTPDRLLLRYPQTAIYVGQVDPLHDDAYRFALRMNESGSKSKFKVIIYQGMTHLFLNLDLPIIGLPECRLCILDSATLFSQVIEEIK